MESTLTSKGQITLPKLLRDIWHLKAGDKILFEPTEEGGFLIKPRTTDVQSLKGFLSYKGKPVSVEGMDQAIISHTKQSDA